MKTMPPTTVRRILATSALPYANGQIHLGHLVEYIQTDIFVRFQKLRGHRAIYLCADDTHGTAIMIRARVEGRSERDLIAAMRTDHLADFSRFQIAFDHYGSTDSDANRQLCGEVWQALRARGLVTSREVRQLYDPTAGVFLADRFVRGTCPRCQGADQYAELRDWDISRPAPYFGFEIPDAPGHYWYVWFDAPIGYMAATSEWCAAQAGAG